MTTAPHTGPAIEAVGLVKRYGTTTAVNGVDLTVGRGSVLGLLGPNGAGKTTLIRVLATLLSYDQGSVAVGGFDVARHPHQVRQLIGVTGQEASVDGDLTGSENLRMIGRLLGLSRAGAALRADELLSGAGLEEAAGRTARTYSGGMRRRLDLAASLVNRPAVVFLDEPTAGLDPARRGETWQMVRDLAKAGSTVLLTTQYLEEADHLADEIVVIDAGTVAARGTADELKRRLGRQTLDLQIDDPTRLDDAVACVAQVLGSDPVVDRPTNRLSAAVSDGRAMPAVVRSVEAAGIEVSELALRLPSLDDVFLTLTGKRAAEPPAPTAVIDDGDQAGRAA